MKTIALITLISIMTTVMSCKSTKKTNNPEPVSPVTEEQDETTTNDNELKYIELTDAERQLVNSNNDFAFNLFRAIKSDKSQLVSPLSITYALGMLNNGAVGETQRQINEVLGFGNAGADAINNFCLKMLTECPELDKETKILIANTIYMNMSYKLKPNFVKLAKKYYQAEPETRNFADGKTLDVINKWASDHTEGMITQVLTEDEFDPSIVSYLLNALYFKGTWADKFSESLTRQEIFNNKEKVMMMNKQKKFRYGNNDICQSIELPYGNGAYSMTVLLPHKDKTIDDVIKKLNGKTWTDIRNNMWSALVDLKLPRLETTTDIDLKKVMCSLGMPLAFSNGANFDNFCNTATCIDLMKQVAKIKLDEKGTEASAVTVIGMRKVTSAVEPEKPIEFHADRSFVYVITEQSTGAIFFIGQFTGK